MGRPTSRHLHPVIPVFIPDIQAEIASAGRFPSPLEQAVMKKKKWLLDGSEGRWVTRHQVGEWGTDTRDGTRTGVRERLPSQPRDNVGAVRKDTSACRCRSDML